MAMKAIELRRGLAVQYKNSVWVCVSNIKIAKGKGRSYQGIQLRNIKTGQLIEERFRTEDQFEPVHVDRKSMDYLYSDGSSHIVMDPDSYEQVNLPAALIGDMSVYLTENVALDVTFIEGEAVGVELPNSVELTVENTPPQVKGATATNQLKDAILIGGAKVRIPPFIENGELIKIDTRTGEYLGRA